MKKSHVKASLALGLLVVILCVLLREREPARKSRPEPPPPPPPAAAQSAASQTALSNLLAVGRSLAVRRAEHLTAEERAVLEAKFPTQIKPAVEQWCKAYAGHVPFKPEDLILDKFKERIGLNTNFLIYTFMLDGITFCVHDYHGRVAVNYLYAPGANQLVQLPAGGTVPSLQMPVTRDEVIRMVKADTNTEFKPHEVELKPTGRACAMQGGAFVHIAPLGGDPDNGLCKVSLVFGPNGQIVYYSRDPTF